MRNEPSAAVTVSWLEFVAILVMMTWAPTMAPPDLSWTVPCTEPVTSARTTAVQQSAANNRNTPRDKSVKRRTIRHPPWGCGPQTHFRHLHEDSSRYSNAEHRSNSAPHS